MIFALFSDIHSNLHALEACLGHARAQGAERLVFLGDLVGYGGQPREVLETVMNLKESGAIVVAGNHDEMALTPPANSLIAAALTADWTHSQLSGEHLDFLQKLPKWVRHDHILFTHASAHEIERWHYIDHVTPAARCIEAALKLAGCRHTFVGHVHEQALFIEHEPRKIMQLTPELATGICVPAKRHCVATIGSVGQPRDGDQRAMYAICNTQTQCIWFHRVAYDFNRAAATIRKTGLPEICAHRLEMGR